METVIETSVENGKAATKKQVIIETKNKNLWPEFKEKYAATYWTKYKLVIKLKSRMYGGVPAQLDAANYSYRSGSKAQC